MAVHRWFGAIAVGILTLPLTVVPASAAGPSARYMGIEDNLRTLGVEWQCTGGDIMADGTIRHRQPRPA